jgi:hypothetical protein
MYEFYKTAMSDGKDKNQTSLKQQGCINRNSESPTQHSMIKSRVSLEQEISSGRSSEYKQMVSLMVHSRPELGAITGNHFSHCCFGQRELVVYPRHSARTSHFSIRHFDL